VQESGSAHDWASNPSPLQHRDEQVAGGPGSIERWRPARIAPRCEVLIECKADTNQFMVAVDGIHPAHLGVIADTLSDLWPRLLAPAGVGLTIIGGDQKDVEAMALRCLRRGATLCRPRQRRRGTRSGLVSAYV
jgi:hypothetical protein